mmetsp:Transcript_5421/g.8348  ORF Transcript_5421/g.8348 Transcript_5421/m.8348 type:complete len:339 (+) Transcript_5421:1312-2328(+)
MGQGNRLSCFDSSVCNSRDTHLSFERIVIDVGYKALKCIVTGVFNAWWVDRFHDSLEQWTHIFCEFIRFVTCLSEQSRCIYYSEIGLLIGGTQLNEQIKHLVNHKIWTSCRTVDFVDNNHCFHSLLQGLVQHKSCLWLGSFDTVHHEQHTVTHIQDAFHFSTKVSVPWCVHNVDFNTIVHNSQVLGKNGDTTLTFLVFVVHNGRTSFCGLAFITKHTRLFDQSIHQGRFSVVDVSNHSNITKFCIDFNLFHWGSRHLEFAGGVPGILTNEGCCSRRNESKRCANGGCCGNRKDSAAFQAKRLHDAIVVSFFSTGKVFEKKFSLLLLLSIDKCCFSFFF